MSNFSFKDIAAAGERYSTMAFGERSVFVSASGLIDSIRVSDMQSGCGSVSTYTPQQARALARELLAAAGAIDPQGGTGVRRVAGNEAMTEGYDADSECALVTVDGTVLAVSWHEEGGRGSSPCIDSVTHCDLTLTSYELSRGYLAQVQEALEKSLGREE